MPQVDNWFKVSIVIATHNMGHVIGETIRSCIDQIYPDIEIVIYDDCSTDDTMILPCCIPFEHLYYKGDNQYRIALKYIRGETNLGVGGAFNKGIKEATGDYIVLMCADDLFTCREVLHDIVNAFSINPRIGHVTRWYYQFVNEDPKRRPCRAWRGEDIIVLANNPSGLAFRKEALQNNFLSNKMFIESSFLVRNVSKDFWGSITIRYDTVAVRVHKSTSTQRGYWLKRRVSSPVLDWYSIGGNNIAKDYVSLIQIKRGFTLTAVWEEICNFVKVRPANIINPLFWFWSIVALTIPRRLAVALPEFYRYRIGRFITHEIRRSGS